MQSNDSRLRVATVERTARARWIVRAIAGTPVVLLATMTSALAAPFDDGAMRTSLAAVRVVDCGSPAPRYVDVVFAFTGDVTSLAAEPGSYDPPVVACVEGRYRSVKITPFDGTAIAIRYEIPAAPVALPPVSPPVVYIPAPVSGPAYSIAPTYPTTALDPRAPPDGYHYEERRKSETRAIVGGVLLAAGLITIIAIEVSQPDSTCHSSDDCVFRLFGGLAAITAAVTGTVFLVSGLQTYEVLAPNEHASMKPRAHGVAVGFRF